MGRLLCLIGYHKWQWWLSTVGYVDLNTIPPHAKCKRCGVRYDGNSPDEAAKHE